MLVSASAGVNATAAEPSVTVAVTVTIATSFSTVAPYCVVAAANPGVSVTAVPSASLRPSALSVVSGGAGQVAPPLVRQARTVASRAGGDVLPKKPSNAKRSRPPTVSGAMPAKLAWRPPTCRAQPS